MLGFAGPEFINVDTGDIIEGVAFMNGGSLLGPNAFPVAEFLSVQVHEYGHYQNLAHTIVNGQIVFPGDTTGPSPNNTFPPPASFVNRIETMYPFLFVNGGQATLDMDDIAIFSTLYPDRSFARNTVTITGNIIAPNNKTRLTGVNVIARNIAKPFDDAVSAISSNFTNDYSKGSPFVGTYTFRGLTPGADYAIYVDQILPGGGFSTPPRPLPGPEEFYSGKGESNDFVADDPSLFTPVGAKAGKTVRGIDITFNRLPPGAIPAGDETSTEIFPRFPINLCGQTHDSVFVNSNGHLTFGEGAGLVDFFETVVGHLTGPPRIAALWVDLDASAGGSVSFSETSHSITFRYTDVPEFLRPGTSNTFATTLFASGDGDDDSDDSHHLDDCDDSDHSHGGGGHGGESHFRIAYGDLTAGGGLAGYSCGGRITSGFERERDLSALPPQTVNGSGQAAIFEKFTANDNDLDNRTFNYLGPNRFRDEFEPNNSLRGRAKLVTLPFNTADRFTDISPTGDDVDYYRFKAKAGDILAIETVPGLDFMDTLIGLFDSGGNLLALDDDGGSTGGVGFGGLSRLLVQVSVDDTYAVAVTTFPDFEFTGAGGDFGRYVLSISSYRGTLIQTGDDGSVLVPLTTFTFPFQGTNHSSVFVNGNGNLTFGVGSSDFSESVAELLNGPPRIAPLWRDLFAPVGLVIAEEKDQALRVHYVSVPDFFGDVPNYFTVVLDRTGKITMDYGATYRGAGLVGVTQGGGAANPGSTDLSKAPTLSAGGTTYEHFPDTIETFFFGGYGGVDLSFKKLKFKE